MPFCDWLISYSICPQVLSLLAIADFPFLFKIEKYYTHTHTTFYLSTKIHLGYFHILATINSAAINMVLFLSLQIVCYLDEIYTAELELFSFGHLLFLFIQLRNLKNNKLFLLKHDCMLGKLKIISILI